MPRKITTIMLEDAARVSGVAPTIEGALREVPGVLHAYVNPSTEAAYVEYDSDRCDEADLDAAVKSVGIQARRPAVPRGHPFVPVELRERRLPMRQNGAGSRTWWIVAGSIVIVAFVLLPGQRTSLLGALPFLFLLACPLLHRLGHGAHGGHRHGDRDGFAASAQEGAARDRDQLRRNRRDYRSSPLSQLIPGTHDHGRGEA